MIAGTVPVLVGRVVLDDELPSVQCVRCRASVEFHQPDVLLPHRLLATCQACESWTLINLLTGEVLCLPGREDPGITTPDPVRTGRGLLPRKPRSLGLGTSNDPNVS